MGWEIEQFLSILYSKKIKYLIFWELLKRKFKDYKELFLELFISAITGVIVLHITGKADLSVLIPVITFFIIIFILTILDFVSKNRLVNWLRVHRPALAFITPPPPKKVLLEKPAVLDLYELYKEINKHNEKAIEKERPRLVDQKVYVDPIEVFINRIAELKHNYEAKKLEWLYREIEEKFNLEIEELIKFRKGIQIDQKGLGLLEPLIKIYDTCWELKVLGYPDINIPELNKRKIIEDVPIYKILIKNLKRMFSLDSENGLYISVELGSEIGETVGAAEGAKRGLTVGTQLAKGSVQAGMRRIYKIDPKEVIIFGQPGRGKSTFLAYLGYYFIFKGYPVLVYLKEFKKENKKLDIKKFEIENRNIIILVDEYRKSEYDYLKNILEKSRSVRIIGTQVTYQALFFEKYLLEFQAENEGKISLKKEMKENKFKVEKEVKSYDKKVMEIYIRFDLNKNNYKDFLKKILIEDYGLYEEEAKIEADKFFKKFGFFSIQIIKTYYRKKEEESEKPNFEDLELKLKNALDEPSEPLNHEIVVKYLLKYLPVIKEDKPKHVEIDEGDSIEEYEIFRTFVFKDEENKKVIRYYYSHDKVVRILLSMYDDRLICKTLRKLGEKPPKNYYEILSHAYPYINSRSNYPDCLEIKKVIEQKCRYYLVNTYLEAKYSNEEKEKIILDEKFKNIEEKIKPIINRFNEEDITIIEPNLKRWQNNVGKFAQIFNEKVFCIKFSHIILFFDLKDYNKFKEILQNTKDINNLTLALKYIDYYRKFVNKIDEILNIVYDLLDKMESSEITQEIINLCVKLNLEHLGRLNLDPLIELLLTKNKLLMLGRIPFDCMLEREHHIKISRNNLENLKALKQYNLFNYIVLITKLAEDDISLLEEIKNSVSLPILFYAIGKYYNINKLQDIVTFENYIDGFLQQLKRLENPQAAVAAVAIFFLMVGVLGLRDLATERASEVLGILNMHHKENPQAAVEAVRNFFWMCVQLKLHKREKFKDIILKHIKKLLEIIKKYSEYYSDIKIIIIKFFPIICGRFRLPQDLLREAFDTFPDASTSPHYLYALCKCDVDISDFLKYIKLINKSIHKKMKVSSNEFSKIFMMLLELQYKCDLVDIEKELKYLELSFHRQAISEDDLELIEDCIDFLEEKMGPNDVLERLKNIVLGSRDKGGQ